MEAVYEALRDAGIDPHDGLMELTSAPASVFSLVQPTTATISIQSQ